MIVAERALPQIARDLADDYRSKFCPPIALLRSPAVSLLQPAPFRIIVWHWNLRFPSRMQLGIDENHRINVALMIFPGDANDIEHPLSPLRHLGGQS